MVLELHLSLADFATLVTDPVTPVTVGPFYMMGQDGLEHCGKVTILLTTMEGFASMSIFVP